MDSSSACSLPSTRTSVASVTEPALRASRSPCRTASAGAVDDAAGGAASSSRHRPATGVSWSSTALTLRASGGGPGTRAGPQGLTASASTLPLPGANRPRPLGSCAFLAVRRPVLQRGACPPAPARRRGRAAAVEVERRCTRRVDIMFAICAVEPSPGGLAAVGGDSRNIVLPPRLKPIAVRGAPTLLPWRPGGPTPSRMSSLLVPIAHCILARDLVLEAVGQRRPTSPGLSALIASAPASRPTR